MTFLDIFLKNDYEFIDIFDTFIIITLWLIFFYYIRKTEAMKIVIGLFVLFIFMAIAHSVGLNNTASFLKKVLEILLLGFVIIIFPELRMILKKLGSIVFIRKKKKKGVVENIEEAVFQMAENKIGALIVFDHDQILKNHIENYIEIDAKCQTELILTIFNPNTILHDGAMVISNNKIAYVGAKLPLSGKKLEKENHYGTRHLSAIENVRNFDLVAVVVSEETGDISVITSQNITVVKNREVFRLLIHNAFDKKIIKN